MSLQLGTCTVLYKCTCMSDTGCYQGYADSVTMFTKEQILKSVHCSGNTVQAAS